MKNLKNKGFIVPIYIFIGVLVLVLVAGLAFSYKNNRANASWLEIKELGIKLKLPAEIKNLTYAETNFATDEIYRAVSFSTRELEDLHEGCKASYGPLGMIVVSDRLPPHTFENRQYTESEFDEMGGKKIGSFYYRYEGPEVMCAGTNREDIGKLQTDLAEILFNSYKNFKLGQNPGLDTSTIKNETADWKTYRNEEYGFEFKYPAELITATGGDGGGTGFAPTNSGQTDYMFTLLCGYPNYYNPTGLNSKIEMGVNEFDFKYDGTGDPEKDLNGVGFTCRSGMGWDCTQIPQYHASITFSTTGNFETSDRICELQFSGKDINKKSKYKDIINSILSTFKFTN